MISSVDTDSPLKQTSVWSIKREILRKLPFLKKRSTEGSFFIFQSYCRRGTFFRVLIERLTEKCKIDA